jgi:hypothetical protein
VPENLVSDIESAIQNGRKLQQLVNEAGVRYTQAVKRERMSQSRK